MASAPRLLDQLERRGRRALRARCASCSTRRASPTRSTPTLVRGLDYYTRTVFEFTSDALGAQSGVGGGGRYDGLVEQLGGPPTPGMGWAAGIERILLAGEARRRRTRASRAVRRARGAPTADLGRGRLRAARARRARPGCPAQMELGGRSLKGQLGHADALGARYVAIVGRRGDACCKDMQDGGRRSRSRRTPSCTPSCAAHAQRSERRGSARGEPSKADRAVQLLAREMPKRVAMAQISRPFQIALAVVVAARGACGSWRCTVARQQLQPAERPPARPSPTPHRAERRQSRRRPDATVYHGAAPGVEGLTERHRQGPRRRRDLRSRTRKQLEAEVRAGHSSCERRVRSDPPAQPTPRAHQDRRLAPRRKTASAVATTQHRRTATRRRKPPPPKRRGHAVAVAPRCQRTASSKPQLKRAARSSCCCSGTRSGADDVADVHGGASRSAVAQPRRRRARGRAQTRSPRSASITRGVPGLRHADDPDRRPRAARRSTLTGLQDAFAIEQAIGEARTPVLAATLARVSTSAEQLASHLERPLGRGHTPDGALHRRRRRRRLRRSDPRSRSRSTRRQRRGRDRRRRLRRQRLRRRDRRRQRRRRPAARRAAARRRADRRRGDRRGARRAQRRPSATRPSWRPTRCTARSGAARARSARSPPRAGRTLVAMSGGVDSAVAALLRRATTARRRSA